MEIFPGNAFPPATFYFARRILFLMQLFMLATHCNLIFDVIKCVILKEVLNQMYKGDFTKLNLICPCDVIFMW